VILDGSTWLTTGFRFWILDWEIGKTITRPVILDFRLPISDWEARETLSGDRIGSLGLTDLDDAFYRFLGILQRLLLRSVI
jgi:hypothetical protein